MDVGSIVVDYMVVAKPTLFICAIDPGLGIFECFFPKKFSNNWFWGNMEFDVQLVVVNYVGDAGLVVIEVERVQA